MLKLSIAVAAALLGTAAIAQDANMGSPTTAPSDTAPAANDSMTMPAPDTTMTQGAGTTSNATDTSATPMPMPAASADASASKNYPRCSRTVTDSCIQGGARTRHR